MHMQSAIPAQPTFVINKPQLAEFIHEETDALPGPGTVFTERLGSDTLCIDAFSSWMALATSCSVDPNRSPITLMA